MRRGRKQRVHKRMENKQYLLWVALLVIGFIFGWRGATPLDKTGSVLETNTEDVEHLRYYLRGTVADLSGPNEVRIEQDKVWYVSSNTFTKILKATSTTPIYQTVEDYCVLNVGYPPEWLAENYYHYSVPTETQALAETCKPYRLKKLKAWCERQKQAELTFGNLYRCQQAYAGELGGGEE